MLRNSDMIKAKGEYWRKKFEGEIPVLDLPYDFPRPPEQSFRGRQDQV